MGSERFSAGLSLEEKVSSLFQPDTLLPAQYLQTVRKDAYPEPEKRLMMAILKDAITSFQEHLRARDRRGKTLFREAENWIWEKDQDSAFSFDNVCEVLGFDPGYIHKELIRWKQEKLSFGPKSKSRPLFSREKGRRRHVHNRYHAAG